MSLNINNMTPGYGANGVNSRSNIQNSGSKIESEFSKPMEKLKSLLSDPKDFSMAVQHTVNTIHQLAKLHPLEKDLEFGGRVP